MITGRCNDAALALGPMVREFGWKADDWDRIAAGTIAGHVIECGAQCTGGNCQADWESVPDFAGIGYPIIEAESDGTFVITKHAGTGGRVNVAGVTEQLLYEIGDPKSYITPDGIADFTTIRLEQQGPDRVRFSGMQGRPRRTSTKSPSVIPLASKPWARWPTRGLMRTKKPGPQTIYCASALIAWGSNWMRFIPSLSV